MNGFILSVGAVSDVGLIRDRNEDTVGVNGWTCSTLSSSPQRFEFSGEEVCLLTIADGLGGHPDGDIASRMVVQSLADNRGNMIDTDGILGEILIANDLLYEEMTIAPSRQEMGTTIAGLVVTPDTLFVFNVGDSTVFEYFGGYLVERTRSDGLARSSSKSGPNTVVVATLGGTASEGSDPDPHLWSDRIGDNRRFLICSDGLTNYASIDRMEGIMQAESDDLRASEQLLALAFEQDAPDNVSIIVATLRSSSSN